jgi:D-alanyl-D-alanine carboxypeptidase (penicillin-binding protein 5/6)
MLTRIIPTLVLLLISISAWAEPLKNGSNGPAVEDLQRTLNARLKPSPGLSVDGNFGANTEKAVKRFQRQHKLPVSGLVDDATLKALGPLVRTSPAVPDPEEVNNARLDRQPADPLDGAPFVTCKAWAIADGANGKVLADMNGDSSLDMASTTKIMTAFVILTLAEKSPDILSEQVVFSARADQTVGSTSGVHEGERLTVEELLYGLLLPSGNDASVALAEHFGARLATGPRTSEADPLDQFVAEMNRQAKRLGMQETHFVNPHGLTAEGHKASAIDLVRLAHASLQLATFRNYVATRQYGTSVTDAEGKRRNVVWRNTNRLLRIEGYAGVKTGTTSAAGACLVSLGRRDGRSLLIVVLGSANSDARYVDSRNLYRWAWTTLAGRRPAVVR